MAIKLAVHSQDMVRNIKKYTRFCYGYISNRMCVEGIHQSVFYQLSHVAGNIGNVEITTIFKNGAFSKVITKKFEIMHLRFGNVYIAHNLHCSHKIRPVTRGGLQMFCISKVLPPKYLD